MPEENMPKNANANQPTNQTPSDKITNADLDALEFGEAVAVPNQVATPSQEPTITKLTVAPKQAKQSKTSFLKKHWVSFVIVTSACLATAVLSYLLLVKVVLPSSSDTTTTIKTPAPKKFYSSLAHLEVDNQEAINSIITAIMIENSPDARPQSGLKAAEVVFEAIAEGGITRFLALYQVNKPQLIGPVRSLREYYVDWLTPFKPSVAHVGGSARALETVRNGSYRDLDQFFNGSFYWRASDRYAPHNVYTSFEKLDALNAKKGFTVSEADVFTRKIPKLKPKQVPEVTKVNLKISGALYNVNYNYDATSNTYIRQVGGKNHLDREAGQIAPNAVIAIMTDMRKVMEDGYREQITTIGSGKAYVFQNGQLIEATWKKPSQNQQIRFYDAEDKEIAINAGQAWITAIPNGSGAVSWE